MTIDRISIEWQMIEDTDLLGIFENGLFGHLYLVARESGQSDGDGYAISAYPEGETTSSPEYFGNNRLEINKAYADGDFSALNSGYGRELADTHDEYEIGDTETTRGSLDLTAAIQGVHGSLVNLDDIWTQMVTLAQEISDAQYSYDLKTGVGHMINSNSVIATVLSKIGIDASDVFPANPTFGYPGDDTLISGAGDDYLRGWDNNDIFLDSNGGNDLFHGGDGTNLVRSDNTDGTDRVFYSGYESVRVNTASDSSSWQAEQVLDSVTYVDTLQSIEWFAAAQFLLENEVDLEENDQGINLNDDDEEQLLLVQGIFGDGTQTSVSVDLGSGPAVNFSNFASFIGTDYADSFVLRHVIGRNFDGGDGVDTISYAGASNGVFIDFAGGQVSDGVGTDTFSSIENATGSDFEDYLFGDSGNNILDGGLGNDTFIVSEGNDTYIGGAAIWFDTLDMTSVTDDVEIGASAFANSGSTIQGTLSDIELVKLGSGNDEIFADFTNGGSNFLIDAGDGDDTVFTTASPGDVSVRNGVVIVDHAGGLDFSSSVHVVNAEKISAGSGTMQILQFGHEYLATNAAVIYDYSAFATGLDITTTHLITAEVTNGVDTDILDYAPNAEIIGTNHGDTFTLNDADALIWLGLGDDDVVIDKSTVVYTGGHDDITIEYFFGLDAVIKLAPFIDVADVSVEEINHAWNMPARWPYGRL